MNNYEVLYIIENALDEEAKEAVVAKYSQLVTAAGGSIEKLDKWGTKKLAYPINFKTEGYYVLMLFAAKADFPAEMDRLMRIDDNVIRQMILAK